MRKFHYILLMTIAALVSNCDTDDDGFYNSVYATVPGLVTMDAHSTTYAVGEKLYINADFSRYLNEGSTILDAYKTTGATQFIFSYVIEKQVNANDWQIVAVNDSQLDIVKGIAQNDPYVYAVCVYNPLDETYEYRVGFPLLTAGTYRLSYGYNSDSTNNVELRSISPKRRLIMNIKSAATGLDASGFYNFTVN